eukprot:c3562_g1_i1.p1 GENE.c3562_g1_i1~~c3562_g1_i1.p1  ORF type:complete len:166 (+),score=37.39 c3562_g1_i1:82-579(+)
MSLMPPPSSSSSPSLPTPTKKSINQVKTMPVQPTTPPQHPLRKRQVFALLARKHSLLSQLMLLHPSPPISSPSSGTEDDCDFMPTQIMNQNINPRRNQSPSDDNDTIGESPDSDVVFCSSSHLGTSSSSAPLPPPVATQTMIISTPQFLSPSSHKPPNKRNKRKS